MIGRAEGTATARLKIHFRGLPPRLRLQAAFCTTGSRRKRRDRRLRFLAGPESQVVRRYVDDHCQQNEESRHPEKRAMMHPFPIRTVRRVFGVVGSAVLLEFGIIHGRAIDSSVRPRSPTIFFAGLPLMPMARGFWTFVGLPLAGRPFVSAGRRPDGPDARSGPTI